MVCTVRRNACIAALDAHMETAKVNLKTCFDMDIDAHPIPDEDNPICKLHYDEAFDIQ